jgi:hypothetical protein
MPFPKHSLLRKAYRSDLSDAQWPEFEVMYANGDRVSYVMTAFECKVLSGTLKPDQAGPWSCNISEQVSVLSSILSPRRRWCSQRYTREGDNRTSRRRVGARLPARGTSGAPFMSPIIEGVGRALPPDDRFVPFIRRLEVHDLSLTTQIKPDRGEKTIELLVRQLIQVTVRETPTPDR